MVARENFSRSIKANVNPNEAIAKANSKATSTEDTSSEVEGEEAAAVNEGPDIGERGNSPRTAKVKKESLDKAKSKDLAKSAPPQPAVNPILNNTVQTSLDSSSS